jgi:signal transduction histidine kinase
VAELLEERLREILTERCVALGAAAAGVFLVDGAGTNLELTCWVGYREENVERFRRVPVTAPLPLADAFRRAEPVLIGTPEDYGSRYAEFAASNRPFTFNAMAMIPLQMAGRVIGAIALGFPMPWIFGDETREGLSALAVTCVETIEKAGASGATSHHFVDRSVMRLARLHAFTGGLAQAISWLDVVEAVVGMGAHAAGARSCALWMRSDDGATVSLARSAGPAIPVADRVADVPLDRSAPIVDAIRDASPVWIESRRQLGELYPAVARSFSDDGDAALACAPLIAQGHCFGGLAFRFEGSHAFLEDERSIVQVIAWHSAQALERARLYTAAREARVASEASRRRSEFLASSGAILSSSLALPETLTSLTRAAVPSVADWCIVELKEQLRQGPPVVAHVDPTKAQLVLDLSRRFRALGDREHGLAAVMASGRSVLYRSIPEAETREAMKAQPGLAELYFQSGMVSAMVVPIAAREHTLGAILLVSARRDRLYGPEDLVMAEELGRRAGMAIDNARLYEEARRADRLKNEFLAMLGHELRSPLAAISMALDLMRLQGGDVFQRERAILSRQVKHVVRLVDDLLDVSRITRGKIQLRPQCVELSEVIERAIEMASPLLEKRAHRLKLAVPAIGLLVMADPGRLAQAVANLLNNAAKYSEHGDDIAVTAGVEGQQVWVAVRDCGIGIEPDQLATIFDLFVQAKASLDRAHGGLGIGLTLVRSLVELHGGSVSATSRGRGQGSEFVIRLPAAPAGSVASIVREVQPAARPFGRSCRILVVDDNVDVARTLAEGLRSLGSVVVEAFDGPSALAIAESFAPELALLDIGIPEMDGYELARRLRAMPVTSDIRLVALTGFGQDADRQRSSAAGFDEHLVKPVELATLREILERLG